LLFICLTESGYLWPAIQSPGRACKLMARNELLAPKSHRVHYEVGLSLYLAADRGFYGWYDRLGVGEVRDPTYSSSNWRSVASSSPWHLNLDSRSRSSRLEWRCLLGA